MSLKYHRVLTVNTGGKSLNLITRADNYHSARFFDVDRRTGNAKTKNCPKSAEKSRTGK